MPQSLGHSELHHTPRSDNCAWIVFRGFTKRYSSNMRVWEA